MFALSLDNMIHLTLLSLLHRMKCGNYQMLKHIVFYFYFTRKFVLCIIVGRAFIFPVCALPKTHDLDVTLPFV